MSQKLTQFFLSPRYATFMYYCCLVYCAVAMPQWDIASDLKSVLLIGGLPVLFIKFKRGEIHKAMVYLLLASIVIQVISWANSLLVIPENAKDYPSVKLLMSLFLFAVMSLWIDGDRKKQRTLFSVLVISYIVTAFIDNAMHDSFARALSGRRVDYGMHNAQYTTMMAAVIMMLAGYLFATTPKLERRVWHWLALIFVLAFGVFSLIASQSRQVWLGLIALGATFPLMYAVIYKAKAKVIVALYLCVALLSGMFLSNDYVQQRVVRESEVATKILSMEWENIPMTSIGIRFNSWVASIDWIKQSPIVGASKESVRQVIKQSDVFQQHPETLQQYGHLHNYHLETLVAFGLVGLLFLAYYYKEVAVNVYRQADKPTYLFFCSFLLFWLVINNFESFNSKHYGLYILNVVFAGLYVINKKDHAATNTDSQKINAN